MNLKRLFSIGQRGLLLGLLILVGSFSAFAQSAQEADIMRAGLLDNGKMWLFENPPLEYLSQTYDFHPDAAWFEQARMSSLRLPGCSASFVSPHGLVVTNHHCARGSVTQVSKPGETLLEDGFFTQSSEEERQIEGLYLDQLVAIEDVTAEVDAALNLAQTDAERADARTTVIQTIQQRILSTYGDQAGRHIVQVVSLYNGGKFSAYTFRRFNDIRLVMAAELQLGFFGGDADNFTYPRYALDFTFLRVYEDGKPFDSSNHYYRWSQKGVEAGDLVFVIGNPGSTHRLDTVAQLQYRRDVEVEAILDVLQARLDVIEAYRKESPEDEAAINTRFSILNSQKAYLGRRDALRDPIIMARRQDAEQQFRKLLGQDPKRMQQYGRLHDQIETLQQEKMAWKDDYAAFSGFGSSRYTAATLQRALIAEQWIRAKEAGASAEDLAKIKKSLLGVREQPQGMNRRYLLSHVSLIQKNLGHTGVLDSFLNGMTPEAAVENLFARTMLTDAPSTTKAVEQDILTVEDPAIVLVRAIAERYTPFTSAYDLLEAQEAELGRQLGRARFDVYGTTMPPDATFSLRFTDGVVQGYDYNGTVAPPYTTFYGLYDHYYSYGADSDWNLPPRWLNPPPEFNKATPLNFVSTSDTIGGNSGSPAVTRNLELVGLNFDRTIEGLSRDYIYLPFRGRNVMVDVRAILESLDAMYDQDRLVYELTTGQLATEAEADAVGAGY